MEEKKSRMTNQRLKILEYLKGVKTHPNAETIYYHVKQELPAITLATVYRNLNILVHQGKVRKIEVNNEARFDADLCSHQHFICRNCRKIFDLDNKKVSEYARKNIDHERFQTECVTILYHGLCERCKRC